MKIKYLGYVVLAIALLLIAIVPPLYEISNTINPVALSLYLAGIGTIASAAIVTVTKKWGNVASYFKGRVPLIVMIIVGASFAAQMLIFSYATHYISASLLAVVYRAWPLLVVLLAPLLMREKIGKWSVVAVGVGFAGLAFTLLAGTAFSLPIVALQYVGLVFFAACIEAVGNCVQKRYHYEIVSSLFMFNLVSLIILVPSALVGGVSLGAISISAIAPILALALVQNVIMTFFFALAFRMVKTSTTSIAFLFVPFITMVIDALFIGEPIILPYVVIAASVVGGLIIDRLAPKSGNYLESKKAAGAKGIYPTIYDVTSAFINTKSDLVYNAMKGKGRVLAFSKPAGKSVEVGRTNVENIVAEANGNGCHIFTNKSGTEHVTGAEFDFIREIMGHAENDIVVLGVGEPEIVEERFADIDSKFKNVRQQ